MKRFIMGFVTCALVMSTPVIFAATQQTIDAFFGQVKLVINGQESGAETLLYEGRTYVQLKDTADILGLTLGWDEATSTATLSTAAADPSAIVDPAAPAVEDPATPAVVDPAAPVVEDPAAVVDPTAPAVTDPAGEPEAEPEAPKGPYTAEFVSADGKIVKINLTSNDANVASLSVTMRFRDSGGGLIGTAVGSVYDLVQGEAKAVTLLSQYDLAGYATYDAPVLEPISE